jgi:hypothetical protein
MVDFHSPAVLEDDFRAYTLLAWFWGRDSPLNSPFDSGGCEVLARRGWHFHVSPHNPSSPPFRVISYPHLPSWEFFVTLDYELSVIRGDRPYRWTIWVRPPLLSGHVTGEAVASC